jgi:hypothetical protein
MFATVLETTFGYVSSGFILGWSSGDTHSAIPFSSILRGSCDDILLDVVGI